MLDEAVKYCKDRGLEFYAVNSNYPEETNEHKTFSRKLQADLFIDDRNIGGLPDWGMIYRMVHDHLTYEDILQEYFDGSKEKRNEKKSLFKRLFG